MSAHWGMHTTPRNILTAQCTHNYKHVPPVMTVCVMGDINIGSVISQALKLAMTRSRMAFLPKTSACIASSLPVNVKSSSAVWHSLLLLNQERRGRGEEEGNVTRNIHNKGKPVVSFIIQHMLSGELIVNDPLQTHILPGIIIWVWFVSEQKLTTSTMTMRTCCCMAG